VFIGKAKDTLDSVNSEFTIIDGFLF